jgi:hypothetical protein
MSTYFETEVEWLFYHLWAKKDAKPSQFSFLIPDTIIFKKGSPHTWYFNAKEGVILKKNYQNVTCKKVWKTFIKSRPDSIGAVSASSYTYSDENVSKSGISASMDKSDF